MDAHYNERETLHEIGQIILRSPDLKSILEKVLEEVLALLSLDIGNLRLLEPSGRISIGAYRGYRDPESVRMHHTSASGPGKGIFSPQVIASKKSCVVEDVEGCEGLRTFKREGVRSAIIVPICTEKEALGVIEIGSRIPRRFQPDEIRLLEAIGNQMGIAAQKARLFEEAEQKARHLSALHTVASTVSASLDLDQLIAKALDIILEVTGMDAGDIRLLEGDPLQLDIKVHKGVSSELVEKLRRGTRAGGEAEQVLTTRRSLVFESTQTSGLEMPRQVLSEGFTTAVWVPIISRDKAFGIIALAARGDQPFDRNQLPLLEAIGASLGVALDNARLFEETQRSLERVRALREIDRAITSTLDLHGVLAVLLEKIELSLPYAAATVRLFDKESGFLEPVACRNLDEKEWKAERWRAGRGIPNLVFETKVPVKIGNVQTDPRTRDVEFFRTHGLVSYLGVPLIVKDEILGVLSFYTRKDHEFSKEEVEFLSTLGGQAAIAIHNSQMYEWMTKLTAELSRSNKVKDEFLSVMSHELRTPLNVVIGYTGMIKDGVLGEVNPGQEKALEKIMRRAGEQLSMITSILVATQLEAGEVKVNAQRVYLGDFLDDLKFRYLGSFAKNVSLKWDYPSNLPALRTDTEKLKYILENLIDNALKFTEEGQVKVSIRSHDSVVEFRVADTGLGIAEKFLPVIFERFHQLDSSETRIYGGVGIGLYIVKKFTGLLGGMINVKSKPGEGSTFTVRLPSESYQSASSQEGLTTAL